MNNAGHVLFCSGHSYLPDGTLLVTGGQGTQADGLVNASIYNPFTGTWTRQPDMNERRWYPTNTTLANGDVLTLSGRYNKSFNPDGTVAEYGYNLLPQVFSAQTQHVARPHVGSGHLAGLSVHVRCAQWKSLLRRARAGFLLPGHRRRRAMD